MAESRSVTVGDRIALWRGLRGWTQRQLADFCGLSAGFIGMLEAGQRQLNRRRDLYALADALQCTPEDLTGEPFVPGNADEARAYSAIPDLRVALLDGGLEDPPDVPVRPLDEVRRDVEWSLRQWTAGRYDSYGPRVPRLLDELHVLAADPDERTARPALAALVEANYLAYGLAKGLGHPDLALLAGQQAYEAAVRTGDPTLIGFASWVHVMGLERAGARRRAPRATAAALARMEPHAGAGDAAAQVYGMLHLISGLLAARFEDRPLSDDHLAEADRLAVRTGEGNAFQLHFGPTNVAMWRVEAAVELGEGPRGQQIATAVDPSVLASPTREADFCLVLGRGLAQREDGARDREALRLFLRAERLSSHKVHNDPLVRGIVAGMASRDRSGNADLRSFAQRIGVGAE